jgi:hypothetical protein
MDYTSKSVYEFISKKTKDPIVERKVCKISGTEFPIFQNDLDFYKKISPSFTGKTFQIPVPNLCPEERFKKRLLFKNERKLFRNTCALSHKPIISTHSPDSGFKVYSVKSWRSDNWDPMKYGFEFDWSKSFFEQYKKLYYSVPQISMLNDNWLHSENIEYCQNVAYSKNCYLTTVSRKLENCYYNSNMAGWNRLVDCFFTMESENCYECCDSNHLFGCFRLQYSYNCQNCRFGYDLAGCKDCIWCVNLREKQYCYFNQQLSKQEYEQKKKEFLEKLQKNPETIKQEFASFLKKQIHRHTYNTNAINTYSSNLYNAENATLCYNIQNAKDTKYCVFGDTIEDAMDLTVGWELNLCYNGVTPDHSYKCGMSVFSWSCTNVRYSEMCHHCKDCFGCVWLRNKQYCIFNKQYNKDEYEKTVAKIINKMIQDNQRWDFFPEDIAPYTYNNSTIMDYFPLDKETATKKWYKWRDNTEEINIPEWIKLVDAKNLPFNSNDITDDIINNAVLCEISKRPFRILKEELAFYRKWNIPFPHRHPDIRFDDRIKRMPPKRLQIRKCDKTWEIILSVYPQNTEFKVYGETAFNKEVYG